MREKNVTEFSYSEIDLNPVQVYISCVELYLGFSDSALARKLSLPVHVVRRWCAGDDNPTPRDFDKLMSLISTCKDFKFRLFTHAPFDRQELFFLHQDAVLYSNAMLFDGSFPPFDDAISLVDSGLSEDELAERGIFYHV